MKGIANHSFGYSICREEKFTSTKFITEENYGKYSRMPNASITGDCSFWRKDVFYEVMIKRRQICLTLSFQMGWSILQQAKKLLLSFVYKFLAKFIQPNKYQLFLTDMDSVFFGLSEPTIHEAVDESALEVYDRECWNWLVNPRTPDSLCITSKMTGLWKFEYYTCEIGATLIALSSKCYLVDDGQKRKLAAKGIQKTSLNEHLMEVKMFKDVLFRVEGDEEDAVQINVVPRCENRGFRKSADCGMLSYKLTKRELSAFYVKLRVLPCRIHCLPYEIWLTREQIAHSCS